MKPDVALFSCSGFHVVGMGPKFAEGRHHPIDNSSALNGSTEKLNWFPEINADALTKKIKSLPTRTVLPFRWLWR